MCSLTFEKDEPPNPYATHGGRTLMGQQELLELMTNTSNTCVCKDLLFWPNFWYYEVSLQRVNAPYLCVQEQSLQ